MDFGPLDHDQMHVLNSEPLITLVKSKGYDFISQLANREVTRGCVWTLQLRSNGENQGGSEPVSWDRGLLIAQDVASS